jgi:hypothetical protein
VNVTDLVSDLGSLIFRRLKHVRHMRLSTVPGHMRMNKVAFTFILELRLLIMYYIYCYLHEIMIDHEAKFVCFFVKCRVLPYAATP